MGRLSQCRNQVPTLGGCSGCAHHPQPLSVSISQSPTIPQSQSNLPHTSSHSLPHPPCSSCPPRPLGTIPQPGKPATPRLVQGTLRIPIPSVIILYVPVYPVPSTKPPLGCGMYMHCISGSNSTTVAVLFQREGGEVPDLTPRAPPPPPPARGGGGAPFHSRPVLFYFSN